MAAGLSSDVADAFARAAIAGDEELRTQMARAVREGASPSADALRELRDALVAGMREHAERGEMEPARTLGIALAYLPAEGPERDIVLNGFRDYLDSFGAKIACATAFGAWRERSQRAEDAHLAVLREDRSNADPPLRRFGGFQITFPWGALQDAIVVAASELLPNRADIAPLVAARSRECSMHVAGELEGLLIKHGHSAESLLPSLPVAWSAIGWDADAVWNRLLDLIAGLGPHVDLTLAQSRRMTELADLIATLGFSDAGVWHLAPGLRRPELAELIDGIATLADFDKTVVASEAHWAASQVREGQAARLDVSLFVMDGAEGREVDAWDSVESPADLRLLCMRALGWESWLAHCAAEAVASIIAPDDELIRRLEATLASVAPDRRRLVAAVLDDVDPSPGRRSAWASDADPMLRRAGAEALSSTLASGEVALQPAVLRLLNDADAGVVEEAIEGLLADDLTADLVKELKRIAALEQPGWFCAHCSSTNPPGSGQSCMKCHIVGPEPAAAAERLLDEMTSS